MQRLCIYAKDLSVIIGKTQETGNKILREIRKAKNKRKGSPVTVFDAAEYLEMDVELIKNVIREMDHFGVDRSSGAPAE